MNYEAQLRIAGAVQIGLALMHLAFPRRFRWDEEMARLSPLNRQMFHVHTLFVCVVLVMIGGLSLFAPAALLEPTSLSRLVLIGFAGFWGLRLYCQWFVYDSSLWRGQAVNTIVHGVCTLIWIYLTAVYVAVRISLG